MFSHNDLVSHYEIFSHYYKVIKTPEVGQNKITMQMRYRRA